MLYLVGPPASGKSTVMQEIRDQLGLVTGSEVIKLWPMPKHAEFRGEPLEDILTGQVVGLSLGRTRPGGFGGTDAIGMASAPEAVAWMEECPALPYLILGEGQRLTVAKFFAAAAARVELTIGYLQAPQEVLDARCKARGSTQTHSFRVAAATRSRNAVDAARRAGAQVVEIDTRVGDATTSASLLLAAAKIVRETCLQD
jgi:ribose 1,5-bisphosphokinase PhnN